MLAHVVRENTAQRGTGIENGSEGSIFDRTGPTEKSGPPREVGRSFRNFSGWTKPFHSVLDRNFRKFWLNRKRPKSKGKFTVKCLESANVMAFQQLENSAHLKHIPLFCLLRENPRIK